jgi:hypothetical protein
MMITLGSIGASDAGPSSRDGTDLGKVTFVQVVSGCLASRLDSAGWLVESRIFPGRKSVCAGEKRKIDISENGLQGVQ